MSEISAWSTTAASNNDASPDGWPEGMAPSGVNDSARENMAAIRTWYEDAEWREWGHTVTYGSGTTFTTAAGDGDTTSVYVVGRRVRAVGSSTGTIYGRITASSHSTTTTVTVAWDSGSLSNESLAISVGFLAQYQPLTTRGDLLTRDASGLSRLAVGNNGQVLASDGTDTDWVDRQTIVTPVDMSGIRETTVSSIPTWAKTIVIGLSSIVKAGTTDVPLVQIGDSGGVEAADYLGTVWDQDGTNENQFGASFLLVPSGNAGNNTFQGHVTLQRLNAAGTRWSASWNLSTSNATFGVSGAGTKTLSAQLDRVKFGMSGSTDDFTSGEITVIYS